MSANRLTGIRTGAATGLASKYLGRRDARVAGLFGAGVQGWYQVAALKAVHPLLRELRLVDPDHQKALEFAAKVTDELDVLSTVVTNPRDAVAGCDLVVTATAATSPVFRGEWLEEGAHVSGVGSNAPNKCELDGVTFQRSVLVVDFMEQVLQEAGDFLAAIQSGAIDGSKVHADLAEIVTGAKKGRASDAQITLFKSVGMAIEDVITASFIYRKAVTAGFGTEIVLTDDVVAMPNRSATA
jgi:ornithine cyclodeaminase/alanine dehydrogenase